MLTMTGSWRFHFRADQQPSWMKAFIWYFSLPAGQSTFTVLRLGQTFPFKSVHIHNSPVTPTSTLPTASQSKPRSNDVGQSTTFSVRRVNSQNSSQTMCCHMACSEFNSRMKNPLSPAAVQKARVVLRCKKNETLAKSRQDRMPSTQPTITRRITKSSQYRVFVLEMKCQSTFVLLYEWRTAPIAQNCCYISQSFTFSCATL